MQTKLTLQVILAFLARAAIRKYNPIIIGVTGSVGKTSTREAIFAALKKKYKVRASEKNYNTEIGLPLTILGIPHYGKNIFAWSLAFLKVLFKPLFSKNKYPEILILEYGIDRPGDMDYLLSVARPHLAVVTAIGEVPVHVEFFKDPEELIAEKAKLVQALLGDGWAILNHDDYVVFDMKDKTKARTVTFGFSAEGGSASGGEESAEVKITNFQSSISKDPELGDIPEGISFKIEHKGHVVPFWIKGVLGKPPAYAAAAAAGVGIALGMNLVEISEAIRQYISPAGRMRLIPGIKKSFILDDTYNAAPEAMHAAIDTLEALPGKRKIAVLGDMLEVGKYTEQVHRVIGDRVAAFVDLLVTVGPRAKFIADEAMTRGIEKKPRVLAPEQIMSFDNSVDAGKALDPLIRAGDLILVKGSQSMRLEHVVEEIMAEPQRAGKLLVRQDEYWRRK